MQDEGQLVANETVSQQRGEAVLPRGCSTAPPALTGILRQDAQSQAGPKCRFSKTEGFLLKPPVFHKLVFPKHRQHQFHQGVAGPGEILPLKTLGFIVSKMLFASPAPKKLRNFLAVIQLQSNKLFFFLMHIQYIHPN